MGHISCVKVTDLAKRSITIDIACPVFIPVYQRSFDQYICVTLSDNCVREEQLREIT